MNKFSHTLERLMREKGVTYRQLSKSTGVPLGTISRYTTEPKNVTIEHAISLAKFFDVSIDRLFTDRPPIELQRKETILDFKLKQIETILAS